MNDRHAFNPGHTWFFTLATHNRRPYFTDDALRARLRHAVACTQWLRPFEVRAFVVLPDHLHMIWSLPKGDPDYSGRWRLIKRQVQDTMNVPLWQPHVSEHAVANARDYARRFDYIHGNPVRHGLVRHLHDWPHSSFHRCVLEGVYPPDWCEVDFELDLE
jgi:putative transposase